MTNRSGCGRLGTGSSQLDDNMGWLALQRLNTLPATVDCLCFPLHVSNQLSANKGKRSPNDDCKCNALARLFLQTFPDCVAIHHRLAKIYTWHPSPFNVNAAIRLGIRTTNRTEHVAILGASQIKLRLRIPTTSRSKRIRSRTRCKPTMSLCRDWRGCYQTLVDPCLGNEDISTSP